MYILLCYCLQVLSQFISIIISYFLPLSLSLSLSLSLFLSLSLSLSPKVVDHITLLVEDWFSGVRPRILVVPCPHCSHGLPPGPIPLLRSFSINPNLRPSNEMTQDQVIYYTLPQYRLYPL